jgi:hypothetical protein
MNKIMYNTGKLFRVAALGLCIAAVMSTNTTKAQKLSKEAIAADPRASVTIVEEGYTKSPAQIREAYEKLNPEVYFKPYFHPNLRNYYLLDDSKAEMEFWEKSCKTLDKHYSRVRSNASLDKGTTIKMGLSYYISLSEWYMHFEKDNIPAGQHKNWGCAASCSGLMPLGASAMRAGFALFAADPEGLKPFMRYCEAYNIYNAFQNYYIHSGGVDNQISSDGKRVGINNETRKFDDMAVSWDYFFNKWGDERARLIELVKTKTPVKVIQEAATHY